LRGCWTAADSAGLAEPPSPVPPDSLGASLPMLAFDALETRETDWTGRRTLFGETEA
jgi:hypothetical protein